MKTFQAIQKNEDLKKRFIVLFIALSIFKLGMYISPPFVDRSRLILGDGLGIFDMFTGGALSSFSIFAIGIMPYITASIIVMLLQTNVVPILMEWSQQGEHGQKKLKKLTYTLTLILAVLQSIGISIGFDRLYGLVPNATWWKFAIISIVLTLGTTILVLLGEWIEQKGIGKGISMIILAGILMSLPQGIMNLFTTKFADDSNMFLSSVSIILLILFVYALLLFAIYGNGAQRRIPTVSTAVNNKGIPQASQNFFPIPVITTGVIPVIFASALFSFPMLLVQLSENGKVVKYTEMFFSVEKPLGIIVYALLVFFFSIFYAMIQFDGKKLAKNLQESGLYIPTIRAGKETEIYFNLLVKQISQIGAIFLVSIAIVPMLIGLIVNLPQGIIFMGTSLLIVVSVGIDFHSQVRNEVQKTSYVGFYKHK